MDKILILNKLKEYKNFPSNRKFAQFLGISEQNLSKWYERNSYNLDILTSKFPEIDANWFLTGEGNMLKVIDKGGFAEGDGAMNHSNSNIIIEKFINEIAEQRKMTQSIIEQNTQLLHILSGQINNEANC